MFDRVVQTKIDALWIIFDSLSVYYKLHANKSNQKQNYIDSIFISVLHFPPQKNLTFSPYIPHHPSLIWLYHFSSCCVHCLYNVYSIPILQMNLFSVRFSSRLCDVQCFFLLFIQITTKNSWSVYDMGYHVWIRR